VLVLALIFETFHKNRLEGTQCEKDCRPSLLQWLGGSRTFWWMSSNPAGYFDPFQLANFDDPLVRESYYPYQVTNIRETIKRAVPAINYLGASAYREALDENLMAALSNKQAAEEAVQTT